jgi:hypothetical protein
MLDTPRVIGRAMVAVFFVVVVVVVCQVVLLTAAWQKFEGRSLKRSEDLTKFERI